MLSFGDAVEAWSHNVSPLNPHSDSLHTTFILKMHLGTILDPCILPMYRSCYAIVYDGHMVFMYNNNSAMCETPIFVYQTV